MNFKFAARLLALAGLASLTSCVDDGYDLSDVDTTSRFTVENLVVPVNIDELTLKDVITFDDDSKIQPVTIDGKTFYALTQDGDFTSDPISIAAIHADAPHINSVSDVLDILDDVVPAPKRSAKAPQDWLTQSYKIDNLSTELKYEVKNVDESIIKLESIATNDIKFGLVLDASAVSSIFNVSFQNLEIQLPKGLSVSPSIGSYDATEGIWSIPQLDVTGNEVEISLTASRVDLEANGCHIEPDRTLYLNSDLGVKSGVLTLAIRDMSQITFPTSVHFVLHFIVSDIDAKAFSGVIEYKLNGMDIDPVNLTDIPSFLEGPETEIGLANPQIYLQVNNPVAGDKLECSTGISLTPMYDGSDVKKSYMPDNGAITIGYNAGVDGPYNFVMAPMNEGLNKPADFASSLQFVQFTGLRDILKADRAAGQQGLPDHIGISLIDPMIPQQHITDFALGRTLPGVKGKYELVAPLALTNGSTIVYSDRETGWGSDIEDITVEKLRITLTVTNNCPVGVELAAYPLDKNGNRIGNVEVKSTFIEADTSNQEVTIELSGEVKGLDGVEYVATANAGASEIALSPDMSITLGNIRAVVSGYFEKEL